MAKKIGTVTHVFGKISVAILQLDSKLKVGDTVRFKGKHTDFTQVIDSMQVNHQQIQEAAKGDDVGVKTVQKVEEGDEVLVE